MIKKIIKAIFRRPILLFFTMWLLLMHGGAAYLKVAKISPAEYSRYAVDLRDTETTRYGYVPLHHGAILVCARNTPETIHRWEKETETDADTNQDLSEVSGVRSIMLQQLQWYPWKVIFETILYSLFVGYVFFWAAKLRKFFAPPESGSLYKVAFEALLFIYGWTLIAFPLVEFSYGASLYSTWAGPGALSWSSPAVPMGISAETISYRPVMELLCLFPMIFVEITGLQYLLPEMSVAVTAWLAGVLFFGAIGALYRSAECFLRYKGISWERK